MRQQQRVFLVLMCFVGIVWFSSAPAAHAQGLTPSGGIYLSHGQACVTWKSGSWTYTHCTTHWHISNGRIISDNPSWVPNNGVPTHSTASAPTRPASVTVTSSRAGRTGPCTSAAMFGARITQWTPPPGCYANIYYPRLSDYVSRPSFGWCNWLPEVMQPQYTGNVALHLPSHATPRVGSTVFFAPGVQGASSAGHYAYLVGIGPNGWLLVEEMNFYFRGGGWAKIDYRYVHVGAGIQFRY